MTDAVFINPSVGNNYQSLKSKYKHALEPIKVAEEAKKKAQDLADIKIKKFTRKRKSKKKLLG